MTATLFDAIPPAELDVATSNFSVAFIRAYMIVASSMVNDDRITPPAMVAGAVRAHAFGLASAIASARCAMPLAAAHEGFEEALIAASVALVRQELEAQTVKVLVAP